MNEDENVTVVLETPEDFREAIAVLAREVVNMKTMSVETARLVQKMDARNKLLTTLVDHLRAVLEKHGLVPPRPMGGSLAN